MTQEDKELLLKDLCARLPYGVIIQEYNEEYGYADNALNTIDIGYFSVYEACIEGTWINHIENVKPYLRSMSSMTEEEKDELRQEHIKDEKLFAECITKAANGDSSMRGKVVPHFAVDWCNKNHFDYRGLIELGLALEAPEGMYI